MVAAFDAFLFLHPLVVEVEYQPVKVGTDVIGESTEEGHLPNHLEDFLTARYETINQIS